MGPTRVELEQLIKELRKEGLHEEADEIEKSLKHEQRHGTESGETLGSPRCRCTQGVDS